MAALVLGGLVAWPLDARADDAVALARADYAAGAAAYDRKAYDEAAGFFALADERSPNPHALQLAMAASLLGSNPVIGMNLVERAEARALDGSLMELARRLRKKFARSVARIEIRCPVDTSCRTDFDHYERRIGDGSSIWVMPGRHVAHIRDEKGNSIHRVLIVAADTSATLNIAASELAPPAPAPAPASKSESESKGVKKSKGTTLPPSEPIAPEIRSSGLSPVLFWTALGLTAATAGASAFLTVQTKQRYDAYVANPTTANAEEGESAQLRARIGWGVTAGLAVTTIVTAILTEFRSGPPSEKVGLAIGPSSLTVVGRFR